MKVTKRRVCEHDGCREFSLVYYDSKKEMKESISYNQKWYCSRHSCMEKILSLENQKTELTFTNEYSKNKLISDMLFWDGNHGFLFGPEFKAWAKDFPEGTKLKLTAEIILP